MGPRGEASPYKTWLGTPSGSSGFVPNSRWLSWEKRKYLRLCRSLIVVTSREGAVKSTNILWTLPFQTSHESWVFYILKTYTRLHFLNYQNNGTFWTSFREVSLGQSLGFHQQTQKLEPPCTPSIINSTAVNYCRFVHSRDINRRDIGLFWPRNSHY